MEHNESRMQEDLQRSNGYLPFRDNVQAPPTLLPAVFASLGLGEPAIVVNAPLDQILSGLHSPEYRVRIAALQALRTSGTRAPLEQIIAALEDENAFVRAAAVQLLGAFGNQIPVDHLIHTLRDRSWYVRAMAVITLGNLQGQPLSSILAPALNDEDPSVREIAQQIMSRQTTQVMPVVGHDPSLLEHHSDSIEILPLDADSKLHFPYFQLIVSSLFKKRRSSEMIAPQQSPELLSEHKKPQRVHKSNAWRFINIVAAFVITVLLVAAFVVLFSLASQHRTLTGASPSPIPSTTPAYMTFQMNSAAMEPTLQLHSILEIDTSAYRSHQPARGDIIVLHAPPDPSQIYIKRVIAIPGDVITIENTKIILNGKVLHESYVSPKNQGNPFSFKKITNLLIPPHDYFVLGDNRAGSSDSRDWGFLPQKDIIGKVVGVHKAMPTPTPSNTPVTTLPQTPVIAPTQNSKH